MIGNSPLTQAFWEKGRLAECPVIDMHGHMDAWPSIYFPRGSTDGMIHTMDQCGVRMLVFCHHATLLAGDFGNEMNIQAVRRYPNRLRAYVGVNPHLPSRLANDLATFDENSDVFVGIKLLADYHQVAWDSPAYEPAWKFANERGLLLLGHTWGKSPYCGFEQVCKAAEKYPRVTIMMAHSLHDNWDEGVTAAKRFPNVYLELTAVLDDRGGMEKYVQAGLEDKMLFGTDLPWFDPHHGIGSVLSADLTDEIRHKILHRNAEKLLNKVGVKL